MPLRLAALGGAAAALGVLVACSHSPSTAGSSGADGSGGACAPGPLTGDLPCDVAAVLKASCQPCHQSPPQNGAHFPLLTYEDTQQPFGVAPTDGGPPKRRWQRMAEVVAPGGQPHMPSQKAAVCGGMLCTLTDAQLATLDAWFAACAQPEPERQGCDVGE